MQPRTLHANSFVTIRTHLFVSPFMFQEDEQAEVEAQQELSNLVNYFQPVSFRGFEAAESMFHLDTTSLCSLNWFEFHQL